MKVDYETISNNLLESSSEVANILGSFKIFFGYLLLYARL